MLPCDLSTEEVFAELRCPSSPVDILIASLVFDVVCVDANQLEVLHPKQYWPIHCICKSVYLTCAHSLSQGDDKPGFEMAEARGSHVSAGRRGGTCIKPTKTVKWRKIMKKGNNKFECLCYDREVLVNTTTQWAVHPCRYLTFRFFGLPALIEYKCIAIIYIPLFEN